MRTILIFAAWLAIVPAATVALAATPPYAPRPAPEQRVERLLIKLKAADSDASRPASIAADESVPAARLKFLAERHGLRFRSTRALGAGLATVSLEQPLPAGQATASLEALRADSDVEFAEVDRRRFALAIPDDTLYANQWYLQANHTAAIDAESAWDVSSGAADTVIAILDTGVRFDHPDLGRVEDGGRLLSGFDFVSGESSSSFKAANDGDGWDSDPSDPGDWISDAEAGNSPFQECDEPYPSSWHGTRVTGLVGAATNNGTGIAAVTWTSRVLPVRVLGKCGGFDSDIIAGMRWAAGLPVQNAPINPTPANIINMSLGSDGTCSNAYRLVIDDLEAAGVLVVSSAGNEGGAVNTPANCPGVLAVAGVRHVGTKLGYSSLGPEVGISAPSGNCPEIDTTFMCSFQLTTTSNAGLTSPGASIYTDDANESIGTSFSSPIVAAVTALMHGVNDSLTPGELTSRLQASARPFASEAGLPTCPSTASSGQCNCTTTTCGAGMVDAPGALAEALRPIARIADPGNSTAGKAVVLDGAASAAARARTIASYAWTRVAGDAPFAGPDTGPSATVDVPTSGFSTFRLTVTDNFGATDSAEVTVGRAPTSGGGGGGGGGSGDLVVVGALLGALLRRTRHALGQR